MRGLRLHIFLIKEICICTHVCSSVTHILNKRNMYVYTCVVFLFIMCDNLCKLSFHDSIIPKLICTIWDNNIQLLICFQLLFSSAENAFK